MCHIRFEIYFARVIKLERKYNARQKVCFCCLIIDLDQMCQTLAKTPPQQKLSKIKQTN